MKRVALIAAAGLVALFLHSGCGGKPRARIQAQEFYTGNSAATETPDTRPVSVALPSAVAPGTESAERRPVVVAATRPVDQPPVGVSSGSYLILGTVVAEANGQPIYADKVLAKVEPALAVAAKQMQPREFRLSAGNVIRNQVEELIRNELEYAAAQRNNTDDEQQLASAITSVWRQREITKAGGSVAVARERSLNPADSSHGIEFDERVMEQFRLHMVLIYYEKHVWPRVQVSAEDMRRFYDRNLDAMFSEKSAIRFRIIEVSAAANGGREGALKKATDLHERAKRGDDFANLAMTFNDNRAWAKNRGYISMVDETVPPEELPANATEQQKLRRAAAWYTTGSLKLAGVEKALFALNVGEITEIIDEGDSFYVARLEQKKAGRTQAFEDPQVQDNIRRLLTADQRQRLRQKEWQRLQKTSVYRVDEKNLELAIEMAMQKYTAWRGK